MVQIKTVKTEYVGRSIFHDEMACGRLIFFLDCQTVLLFKKTKRCSLDRHKAPWTARAPHAN